MGSPLGLALANIFMYSFEFRYFLNCPNVFKPMFYKRYLYDIFVVFSSSDHADKQSSFLSTDNFMLRCLNGKYSINSF